MPQDPSLEWSVLNRLVGLWRNISFWLHIGTTMESSLAHNALAARESLSTLMREYRRTFSQRSARVRMPV